MKQNEYTITNIKTADEKSIIELLSSFNDDDFDFAKNLATKVNSYGNKVFMRALIEFSNYCKNNCINLQYITYQDNIICRLEEILNGL